MIMVSIALVMAVIVTNLFLRKDSGRRVPLHLRRIFLRRSTSNPPSGTGPPSRPPSDGFLNHVTTPIDVVYDTTPQDIDIDSLSILSEIDALQNLRAQVAPSCVNRRKLSLAKRNSNNVYYNQAAPSNSCNNNSRQQQQNHQQQQQQQQQLVRDSCEWQQLAKSVDTFFFWLFMLSSASSLIGLFASIPHHTPI